MIKYFPIVLELINAIRKFTITIKVHITYIMSLEVWIQINIFSFSFPYNTIHNYTNFMLFHIKENECRPT